MIGGTKPTCRDEPKRVIVFLTRDCTNVFRQLFNVQPLVTVLIIADQRVDNQARDIQPFT